MPKVPRSRSSRFAPGRTSANTLGLGNTDGSFRSHGTFSFSKIVSPPSQQNVSSFQAKRKVSFDVNDCIVVNPSTVYRTSTFQSLPSLEKRTCRKMKRTRTLSRLSRSECLTMLDIPTKDDATYDQRNTNDDYTAATAPVSTLSEDDILSIQSCSCSARLNPLPVPTGAADTAYTSITPASSAAATSPNTTVAASSTATATTTQTLIATPPTPTPTPTATTDSASGTVTNSTSSPKLPSQDNTANWGNSGWGHFVDVVPEETDQKHVPVPWLPRQDNSFVHRFRPYVAPLEPKYSPRARITQTIPRWKYPATTNDISDAMNSISL